MPIYLDRHDTPEDITPEHVAEMHQADLKVQDQYGCRGFTYWFDNKRKSGFCLIEAPNKEALINMHDHAHGAVPHEIIEVQEEFVESFLGRLEDPVKAKDQKLNIIDEPAFRTIMVINYSVPFNIRKRNQYFKKDNSISTIKKITSQYEGRIVQQKENSFLSSFFSVSKAIKCALAINNEVNKDSLADRIIRISLNCGVPVTEKKEGIFEETIVLANRMCASIDSNVVLSSELKELYDLENSNKLMIYDSFFVLDNKDQKFLNSLMDFVEKYWNKTDLKVDDFANYLGISKSQVYRKLKFLSGKSPNEFIKDYRLKRAMDLLESGKSSISETAFEIGFNSPSYFSKCFYEKYGNLPSSYNN